MSYQLILSKDHPRRIFTILTIIQLALVSVYVVIFIINNRNSEMFNLDAEGNIPAWFSSVQLFLTGLVLFAGNIDHITFNKLTRNFIRLMALGFILLSLDESAKIHETLSNLLKSAGWKYYFKGKSGVWIIVYSAVGAAVILWGWRAISVLLRHFKKEIVIITSGFAVLFLGAVVLETLAYQYLKDNGHETLYKIEVAFEEYFEMLGASIMLLGAMKLLLRSQIENNMNVIISGKADRGKKSETGKKSEIETGK